MAAGGWVRNAVGTGSEHRYDRRQAALTDAQDAALGLRDALRAYGTALRQSTASSDTIGSFVMHVPAPQDQDVAAAAGKLQVMMSRVEGRAVTDAVRQWEFLARASFIDLGEVEAVDEQHAFDAVNEQIGRALRA